MCRRDDERREAEEDYKMSNDRKHNQKSRKWKATGERGAHSKWRGRSAEIKEREEEEDGG